MGRHAIYFAPARETLLWSLGVRWLGRDPETGEHHPPPEVPGMAPARVAELTHVPRRYGWHATLKPPFLLRDGVSEYDLSVAMRALCSRLAPVRLPPLEVQALDGFLALVPAVASEALDSLAALCVEVLDPWREPLGDAERALRNPVALDARQRQPMTRWGYPWVFEQFRFHMTLTARLEAQDRERLEPWLRQYFEPALAEPGVVDHLAVFHERAPGAPLELVRRVPLGTS